MVIFDYLTCTQGDLTPIFPTFSNPIWTSILTRTQGQHICQIFLKIAPNYAMYQSQILLPGPHFLIRLILWPILGQKHIFCKPNIKDVQKVPWQGAPLITICIFQRKKKVFAKFLRFSQIKLPGDKIWELYIGAQSICTHYSWCENMDRLVTLKKNQGQPTLGFWAVF